MCNWVLEFDFSDEGLQWLSQTRVACFLKSMCVCARVRKGVHVLKVSSVSWIIS